MIVDVREQTCHVICHKWNSEQFEKVLRNKGIFFTFICEVDSDEDWFKPTKWHAVFDIEDIEKLKEELNEEMKPQQTDLTTNTKVEL